MKVREKEREKQEERKRERRRRGRKDGGGKKSDKEGAEGRERERKEGRKGRGGKGGKGRKIHLSISYSNKKNKEKGNISKETKQIKLFLLQRNKDKNTAVFLLEDIQIRKESGTPCSF